MNNQLYVMGPAGLMVAEAVSVVLEDGQKPNVPEMLTEGISLMVMVMLEVETTQGAPFGLLVVNVNVTVPAEISAALGVYDALSVVLFGVNVPVPPDQVPTVALPPMEPARVYDWLAQMLVLAPALAVGGLAQPAIKKVALIVCGPVTLVNV